MRQDWVVPDEETYNELYEAFRGGNTHANRWCVAPEDLPPMIHYNVKSYDRSSAYPDVMCNMEFPLGKWVPWKGEFNESLLKRLKSAKRAAVFRVSFTNIRLKDYLWGCPYLSKDKAYNLRKLTYNQLLAKDKSGELHALIDNGRVLEASELVTCVTDVDFEIIRSEYEWDSCTIFDVKTCPYKPLPQKFINLIHTYYKNKTELKGVEEKRYLYNESKSKINSLYGMSAQKTVRAPIVFTDNPEELYKEGEYDAQAQIEQAIRKAFLPYSIGVWVTAWARYWLERAIQVIHNTKDALFIYTDTDSVKFTGEVDFTALNEEIKANSIRTKSYAVDRKGKTHYMGVYEYEGTYEKFATMGAKKYIYGNDNEIHVTVAGLVKYDKEGNEISAMELQNMGGFDAFKADTKFVQAGGIEAVYNDDKIVCELEIEGHKQIVTRNVCLRPSTYTLGLSAEYMNLLRKLQIGLDEVNFL